MPFVTPDSARRAKRATGGKARPQALLKLIAGVVNTRMS
jgi:hypothetical protein